MRGENALNFQLLLSQVGTPPHAWGKLIRQSGYFRRLEGTPPHAWGKRS